MQLPQTLAALACLLTLGGCNAFQQSYSGERWPAVASSRVVEEQPASTAATLIGQSTFVATEDQVGDDPAIACAKSVGADLVEWDKVDDGSVTQLESVPVFSGWNWHGGIGDIDIPIPVTKEQYRVHARFYRSRALGGSPIGQAAPSSPPAVRIAAPDRHSSPDGVPKPTAG